MRKQLLIGFLGLLLTGPFVLKCSILIWFAQHRGELIQQYCVNIGRPELDCRATCYLSSQLARADGRTDAAMQATGHLQDLRIEFTEENYLPHIVFFPLDHSWEAPFFQYGELCPLTVSRSLLKPPQSEFTA